MTQTNLQWSQSLIWQNQFAQPTTAQLSAQTAAPNVSGLFHPIESGQTSPGLYRGVSGSVQAATSDSTSSRYHFVRLPWDAKIKRVTLWSTASSTGNMDLNVAYSDSTFDGTLGANQGTVPQLSSANNKLFGAAIATTETSPYDATFANATNFPQGVATAAPGPLAWSSTTTWYLESCNTPLYIMCGLATQPAGLADIIGYVTTTVAGGGTLLLEVLFVQ